MKTNDNENYFEKDQQAKQVKIDAYSDGNSFSNFSYEVYSSLQKGKIEPLLYIHGNGKDFYTNNECLTLLFNFKQLNHELVAVHSKDNEPILFGVRQLESETEKLIDNGIMLKLYQGTVLDPLYNKQIYTFLTHDEASNLLIVAALFMGQVLDEPTERFTDFLFSYIREKYELIDDLNIYFSQNIINIQELKVCYSKYEKYINKTQQ